MGGDAGERRRKPSATMQYSDGSDDGSDEFSIVSSDANISELAAELLVDEDTVKKIYSSRYISIMASSRRR